MKFSLTKLQVKNMNIKYFDLCYTVITNREEKEFMSDDEYENDYINYEDFKTPDRHIGRKNNIQILK